MTFWTEPEGEPGDLVQRMNETVRAMADAPRIPDEPLRLTLWQYDRLREYAKNTGDYPWVEMMGMPVEIIDDPPPSYRESIRDGLERKRR